MKFENTLMESYFKQICKIIKIPYKNELFDDPNWFKQHKWDHKQEEDAERWLWLQVRKSKGKKLMFCNDDNLSDEELKKEISLFVYDFGWTPETYPLIYKKFNLDCHIEQEN
jgi:hypothetical protein